MKKILLSLCLIIGVTIAVCGQVVTFSFTGAQGNEPTFDPDSQPQNASVSAMSRGSGINPNKNSNSFSASAWTTSATIDLNNYFEFTITPNVNTTLSLSSLSLSERRSLTGIRKWEVRSSVDNYATTLENVFSVPDDDFVRDNQTINFPATSAYSAATSAITFRIYGYEAEGSSGTWKIDNVKLFGTTTLPISLSAFEVKTNSQHINLTWATLSEQDNAVFEIMRSGDGKNFTKIGEVKGGGTSKTTLNYTFTDKNALPGVNYYQLKQVDFNGNFSTSKTIAIKSNVAANHFQVMANKQDGAIKLTIFAANASKAAFKIYDLNGKKLTDQELKLDKGYNSYSIALGSAAGLHVASLTTATEKLVKKFVQ
jgi:hypothetical protein